MLAVTALLCALASPRVILRGNTHPFARAEFDRGAAPAGLPMERMLLVLKRSSAQEAALAKFMDEQLDPLSANYHQWLTPEEFGARFGVADSKLQTVVEWLIAQGFHDVRPSKGRTVMEFSGTAGEVQAAFHTSIRKYDAGGEEHWANDGDPEIPAALADVVAGVDSLHDVPKRAAVTLPGCGPAAGFQSTKSCYGIGPYDFATIYNLLPLWNAGIDGSGQSIAILAASNIRTSDVQDFRRVFGLPARDPVIVMNGKDPGVTNSPQSFEKEAVNDAEWAGAAAPGATIRVVVSASTNSTSGFDLSAQYAVDNNLAPVISASYAFCESTLGAAGNQFHSQLWQQAAAQGITVLIGTGDGGAAECDYETGSTPPAPARSGLTVNGIASTPYNVAVGGTDFADLTTAAAYWNPSQSTITWVSAKGYIPESTWNDSCSNTLFGTIAGFSADAETNCNNAALAKYVQASGGGGGRSIAYPKPVWQAGPGVPADGTRDVPDVSLFAGSAVSGSFYLFCEADLQGGAPCTLSGSNALIQGAAGTSISAPAFAGIMAMVVQQTGSRQGNANAVLYKLAAGQASLGCDASGRPSSACIFHDVTAGTISMPCAKGSANCLTASGADKYGLLSGFAAGPGYDLATGLGSVDAFNLVTAAGWGTSGVVPLSVNAGGAVSAAGFTAGAAVAPGSIAAVFGSFPVGAGMSAPGLPLPLILGGLTLKFGDGIPAPVFYASPSQANIEIPWELAGQSQSPLSAVARGQASAAQPVALAQFAPGIFTVNGNQGAVLDGSYHLVNNANPATAGALLQVYCTGLGDVSNRPATGAAAPLDPLSATTAAVTVMIGGKQVAASFAGLTPGLVGLYQVNFQVPAGLVPNGATQVSIIVAGAVSNTIVIAIQ